MEYMIDRLYISTVNCLATNIKALSLYQKFNFIIEDSEVNPDDNRTYHFMIRDN